MRLRRQKEVELLENSKKLGEEAQALLQAFKKIPPEEVTARLAVARQVVDKSVSSYRATLDLLEKLSPTATKQLRLFLKNQERTWEDWLTNPPDPKNPEYKESIDYRLKLMLESNLYQQFADMAFLAAMEAATRRTPEQLAEYLDQLHTEIKNASSELFRDGHYAQAIFEAFKAIEVAVRTKSGLGDLEGQRLMSSAFGGERPLLALNPLSSKSDRDEQDGFMHIYMGVMTGIRNPKAHEIIEQPDMNRTIEYLALASLLMKRIEEASLFR